MHFALARQHLDFFHQHHYIEFEDLLSLAETQTLNQELIKILEICHHITPDNLTKTDLKSLYLSGYDMWRCSSTIKKFILRPQFAEIASNLTKVRPLRIAFDQFFSSCDASDPLFKKPITLHEMSCIQGIVCGCLLQLSSSKQNSSETSEGFIPIPKKAGSGIFFSPDLPLSFDYLIHTSNMQQLLIVYAEDKSLYTYLETDPHTHTLKKLGYVFGDRLKNATHPILFRG
jgi:hypothetical protein